MGWHGSAACSAEGLKSFRTSGSRLNSLEPHWPVPTDSFTASEPFRTAGGRAAVFYTPSKGRGQPSGCFHAGQWAWFVYSRVKLTSISVMTSTGSPFKSVGW